jgi:hypothetical protein
MFGTDVGRWVPVLPRKLCAFASIKAAPDSPHFSSGQGVLATLLLHGAARTDTATLTDL